MEDQLTSSASHGQIIESNRPQQVDRNKISVSIEIRYHGKVLYVDQIKLRYERQIKTEVLRYLLQRRGRYRDD